MAIHDVPTGVIVPIEDGGTLDLMNADPRLDFYLTGSRYAGTAREGSDWDFLVADSEEATAWLTREGFKLLGDADYETPTEGEPHPHNVAVYGLDDVQVKTVRSVENARRTRDLIYGCAFLHEYELSLRTLPDHAARATLWTMAARLAALTIPELAPAAPVDDLDDLFSQIGDDLPF